MNDEIISFYLDYLNDTVANNPLITYIGAAPVKTMDFLNDEEDLLDMFGALGLDKKCVVVCPLNDAAGNDATKTGSHWAGIVVLRKDLQSDLECLYFDSMGSSLNGQAEFALGKLKVLMKAANKASVKVTRVTKYPT